MCRSCHPRRRFSYELEVLLVVSAESSDLELFGRNADIHLHNTVDHAHRVRVHGKDRGQSTHLTGQEVESRPVARALDQALLELTLTEHATVMRADVIDRAPRAVPAVAKRETLVLGVDHLDLADRDLILARDRDEQI